MIEEVKKYTFKRSDMTPKKMAVVEDGHEFFYQSSVEHEDDVSKIWHDIHCAITAKYCFHLDWSPYSYPTTNDLEMWFALGCPTRDSIGDGKGCGNLDTDRLTEALGYDLCIEGY